jgi:hypothetical protein
MSTEHLEQLVASLGSISYLKKPRTAGSWQLETLHLRNLKQLTAFFEPFEAI